jgi:hypothetical protein
MPLAFVDRHPTANEVEKLRLVLSTYQDGTGMLATKSSMTLPGWRDFERSVALVFGGIAQESKAIFDVLLPGPDLPKIYYGLSCKMRAELNRIVNRDGRATIELSNSSGKFWEYLKTKDITQANYKSRPTEVGNALIELVGQWHRVVSNETGGVVDLAKSSYLVLSYNKAGIYQIHQFSLNLPKPDQLNWSFTPKKENGDEIPGRRLIGKDDTGVLFEWYGESGGQLKYYPLAVTAKWISDQFKLEPLSIDREYGVLAKAIAYFPELWKKADTV